MIKKLFAKKIVTKDKSLLRKRFLAFYIDLIIVGLMVAGLELSFSHNFQSIFRINTFGMFKISSQLQTLHFSLFSFCYWAFYAFSYYFNNGRTPGNMIVGITVKGQKEQLGMVESLNRASINLINYFLAFLPYIINFFHPKNYGLAELISNTYMENVENKKLTKTKDHFQLHNFENAQQLEIFQYAEESVLLFPKANQLDLFSSEAQIEDVEKIAA